MLDENLPTFQFKQRPESPLAAAVYFSQHGSEPAAEYVFERAHPSTVPAAAGHYAVALKDPYAADVVYAEVVVAPDWQQPSLSAAELRAAQHPGQPAIASQQTPIIPDTFTIQLYDPDQTVLVRYSPSSLTRTESWEFEMLSQSFKMPTPSQLDRQADRASPGATNGTGGSDGAATGTSAIKTAADFRPRNMFKWKREGRLTKDMTCYNVGKSLGKHKSKEPDITVALFKMGRETTITVYEPNLQRVEMEDRKGLDIVLVLGAEVIRDLYLAPEKRGDLFNTGHSGSAVTAASGKRKNSRTMTMPTTTTSSSSSPTPSPAPSLPGGGNGPAARARTTSSPLAMSGAIGPTGAAPPSYFHPFTPPPTTTTAANATAASTTKSHAIDAETLKLMKQMKKEDDEQLKRQARERQRREAEERRHLEEMLKLEDEQERRRRQAEVDRETERLRQLYGNQGQSTPSRAGATPPPQPPRPVPSPVPQRQQSGVASPPPRRPMSLSFGSAGGGGAGAGGALGPFNSSSLTSLYLPLLYFQLRQVGSSSCDHYLMLNQERHGEGS
ncbi:hypothetical protein BD289DRAFT_463124 [Coniella lustricola]|uniref:Uncharacterized protein n=1 Tax=Coniella lustricola TaxID=2025994 RepID=A0A2T2ZXB2_9PEZI|nr:hypothetical protein BD289DRAFT_463124 [Coniella lustricola]